MIYSAFRHVPHLEEVLLRPVAGSAPTRSGRSGEGGQEGVVTPIPPIRWWQETIETAWKQGKSLRPSMLAVS